MTLLFTVLSTRPNEAADRGPVVFFDQILVEVDQGVEIGMHIDTDEGNACNLQPDTPCELTL